MLKEDEKKYNSSIIQDREIEWISLDNKITILAFAGLDFEKNKGNFFNLNQKIYNKYKDFHDFQLVVIAPKESKTALDNFLFEMKRISNTRSYTDGNGNPIS